jgi:hypothetical protein
MPSGIKKTSGLKRIPGKRRASGGSKKKPISARSYEIGKHLPPLTITFKGLPLLTLTTKRYGTQQDLYLIAERAGALPDVWQFFVLSSTPVNGGIGSIVSPE